MEHLLTPPPPRSCRTRRSIALCSTLLAASGCQPASYRSPPPIQMREEVVGRSVEGREIRGTVVGSGPDVCLLFGVIHGNEPLGEPLLRRWLIHVDEHPELVEGRQLVVIPVANPDGLERRTRTNSRGVDLNRNFPARNFAASARHGPRPASEPETQALVGVVERYRPTRILSIHSPLRMVNYDGPAVGLARAMAVTCRYPVSTSVGYATPGSFGSWAGVDRGIPTITLELGRRVDERDVWARFRESLEEFVRWQSSSGFPSSGARPGEKSL